MSMIPMKKSQTKFESRFSLCIGIAMFITFLYVDHQMRVFVVSSSLEDSLYVFRRSELFLAFHLLTVVEDEEKIKCLPMSTLLLGSGLVFIRL